MSIKLKLYRKYHEALIKKLNFKNRYPEIFPKGKDRIYVPIKIDPNTFPISRTEMSIENFLDAEGYKIEDYIQGTCKKKDQTDTRIFKIGKTLELIKKKKEQAKYFFVTIKTINCRYDDIADIYYKFFQHFAYNPKGGSQITLTVSDSSFQHIKENLSKTYNVRPDNKKPDTFIFGKTRDKFSVHTAPGKNPRQSDSSDIIKEFSNDKTRNVKNIREFLICYSRHPYDLIGMSTDRGWSSCMKHHDNSIIPSVLNDIKFGTIIAYLIRKNDMNINNPVARINIKPFTTYDFANKDKKIINTKNTILIPVQRIYGEKIQVFLDEVNKFIYKSQKLKLKKAKVLSAIDDQLYTDTLVRQYFNGKFELKKTIPNDVYSSIIFYTTNKKTNIKIQENFLNNNILWRDGEYDKSTPRPHYFGNGYKSIFFDKTRNEIQRNTTNSYGIKHNRRSLVFHTNKIKETRLNEIIKALTKKKDPKIKPTEIVNLSCFSNEITRTTVPYLLDPLPKTY